MLYDKSPSSFNDLTHCQLQSVVDTMPHNPFMLFLGVLLQAQARFLQCYLLPKKTMPPNVALIFTRSTAVQQALMIAGNQLGEVFCISNQPNPQSIASSWLGFFYLQTNLQATVMFLTNSTEY